CRRSFLGQAKSSICGKTLHSREIAGDEIFSYADKSHNVPSVCLPRDPSVSRHMSCPRRVVSASFVEFLTIQRAKAHAGRRCFVALPSAPGRGGRRYSSACARIESSEVITIRREISMKQRLGM